MRLAVVGGGPAGYVAALKAAQLGAGVTVIEDGEVGGTCLNRGCIPTKALIASVEALRNAREIGNFGIEMKCPVTPDISMMMERKNRIISTQVKGIRQLFKSWGVTLTEGRGVIKGPERIEVEKRDNTLAVVEADRIIIATGSSPAQVAMLPFDGRMVLSSSEALDIKEIPISILIVGAGAIGCEFAVIFSELGSEVTIAEAMPRILPSEDAEISDLLEREFKKKKIRIITGVSITKAEAGPDGMHTFLSNGKECVTEKILVSAGRLLNSKNIGLEAIGIKTGARQEIVVNEKMESNISGIYAAGDVTGRMLLAHVASREGAIAAINACGGRATMDYSSVPSAVFTIPEIASVGLREHEAEGKGVKIKTGHFHFRVLGRAHAMGETSGFVKIIADACTERILGGHIIGPHASDLIHEITLAMKAGLRVRDVAEAIHCHPALSEGVKEAAEDVYGEAVHSLKK